MRLLAATMMVLLLVESVPARMVPLLGSLCAPAGISTVRVPDAPAMRYDG